MTNEELAREVAEKLGHSVEGWVNPTSVRVIEKAITSAVEAREVVCGCGDVIMPNTNADCENCALNKDSENERNKIDLKRAIAALKVAEPDLCKREIAWEAYDNGKRIEVALRLEDRFSCDVDGVEPAIDQAIRQAVEAARAEEREAAALRVLAGFIDMRANHGIECRCYGCLLAFAAERARGKEKA